MNGRYLDADWYRVKYNLAAQSLNYAIALEGPDPPGGGDPDRHRANAERHAREIIEAAASTLDETGGWHARTVHRGIRRFLAATGEPAAALLLAGAMLARGPKEVVRRHLARWERPPRATPTDWPVIDDRPALLAAVRKPESTSPGRIVGYVVGVEPVGYRVDYNLACYLGTVSRLLEAAKDERAIRQWADPEPQADIPIADRAFKALALAIERAPAAKSEELLEWARSDPSLAHLAARGAFETFLWTKSPVERYKRLLTEDRPEDFGATAATGYTPEKGEEGDAAEAD